MKRFVVPLFACAFLAACASTPSQYYSLAQPAEDMASEPQRDPAQPRDYGLRLSVLQVPAEVDRPQIVIRDPAQDPEVQILNNSLWSAPVADQMESALLSGVAFQLGVPALQRLPGTGQRKARLMNVRINRFDLDWSQAAQLEAEWTDARPGESQPRICHARIRQPVASAGVSVLVDAQRRAIQTLAVVMAHPDRSSFGKPDSGALVQAGCT